MNLDISTLGVWFSFSSSSSVYRLLTSSRTSVSIPVYLLIPFFTFLTGLDVIVWSEGFLTNVGLLSWESFELDDLPYDALLVDFGLSAFPRID